MVLRLKSTMSVPILWTDLALLAIGESLHVAAHPPLIGYALSLAHPG